MSNAGRPYVVADSGLYSQKPPYNDGKNVVARIESTLFGLLKELLESL
jgi:hypothetical protein